jgi:predicted permease
MSNIPRPSEGLGTRVFRALLSLYPAAFRDEYGRELALVFVDRYRDAVGPLDRARLWIEAVVGIVVEAPQEHARMIRQDLGYAWRVLRQHALLTTTIVLTLGLGIGANTAVFSVLNAVALRTPLGVPDPGELYTVNGGTYVASGQESARLSGPEFDALRQAAPDGVSVAAMSRGMARVYTRTDRERETTPASLQLVSSSFFPALGARPFLGGTFPSDKDGKGRKDDLAANERVAVLSYGYWQRRFGGSPDVVGSTLTINGTAFTIVGVGPRDFVGVWLETPVDIWVPLTMQPEVKYSQSFTADGADFTRPWLPQAQIWWLHVVVRVPPEQTAAAVSTFSGSLSELAGRDIRIVLEPFARGFSQFRQQFSTPLVALMVMAALVLLIACANVANVLLARAVGRQREIAIRMAIGAGRARLLRQLLTESALLVVMAGAAAILFARWAGDLLVRIATASVDGPPPFAATVDLRVLAFAAGVAFLCVVISGVWPAWRATRVDVVGALKSSAHGAIGGAASPARVLVVLQVALSLVLVTGTGLFVQSFRNLLNVGLGFEPERLLTVRVDPRLSGAPVEQLPEMYRRVLDSVSGAPGAESASFAMCGLQGSCARMDGFKVEGYQPRPNENLTFSVNAVTPGYFSTLGMRLIAGRPLSESDRGSAAKVAVINRTLARSFFGDWQEAIGRRLGVETPDIEIVGIVDDVRALGNLRVATMPSVFVPLGQWDAIPRELVVRTSVDPASAIAHVRRAIGRAAPELPIESIETVTARVGRGLSQERLVVLLTSGFSVLAIGLAGFGLFGVLSYAVVRRTPELGLRMALGAQRSRVLWGVVRDSLWLVMCGVFLGLPLVVLGSNLVSALIFGVTPYDALSVLAALVVLLAVGGACGIGPAVRAARIDPVVALRDE